MSNGLARRLGASRWENRKEGELAAGSRQTVQGLSDDRGGAGGTAVNAIVQLLVKHGYSVLFVSVFARQMWLPVPAILFLIAPGALADSGRMTLALPPALPIPPCLFADMICYDAGTPWVH